MSNTINFEFRRKRLMHKPIGGISDGGCMTPPRGASKEDLLEFHRETMRNRRNRQFTRQATVRTRKQLNNPYMPKYHGKSIWPDGKLMGPHNRLNGRPLSQHGTDA